jgi:hypothetical protein
MWIIIILCIALIISTILAFETFASNSDQQAVKKDYNHDKMFKFTIDTNIEQTATRTIEYYKITLPLHPERFRRKVKMLWGIDIKDYPDNAEIWMKEGMKLSIKYQTLYGFDPGEELPFLIPNHPDTIFPFIGKYIFFNDMTAYNTLENYTTKAYNEVVGKDYWTKYHKIDTDVMLFSDFLYILYNSIIFQSPPGLINYIESHLHYGYSYSIFPPAPYSNPEIIYRISDMRMDMITLYLSEQLKNGRAIGNNIDSQDNKIWLGFGVDKLPVGGTGSSSAGILRMLAVGEFFVNDGSRSINPWQNYYRGKSMSAYLAFLLQLQTSAQNSTVIQYMSGQLVSGFSGGAFAQKNIRNSIRANNYYGYTLLREFCENPEREMPTLEKIGTSFKGTVKGKNTLLYLEPFADSYDIDTIQPNETFIAYEMGHDDYYFVEVVKPVESSIAGPGGYAVILDRTETVYGYMKKSEVRELTGTDAVTPVAFPHKKKQGTINDPDGYVNIRKEMTAQSEILGKIAKNEVFTYWELPGSGWCIIRTENGTLGYMFRNRIVEKTGN